MGQLFVPKNHNKTVKTCDLPSCTRYLLSTTFYSFLAQRLIFVYDFADWSQSRDGSGMGVFFGHDLGLG